MNYRVKAGDTLSRIAKLSGITLAQLLDANPSLKANPNKLKIGMMLSIPDEFTTAVTRPLPSPGSLGQPTTTAIGAVGAAAAIELGGLSAKYETGGRGPGTVSTGSGDPGGVSYGSYQMATKTGTVKRFVSQADFPWSKDFENLIPGTAPFTTVWKQIAIAEAIAFQGAQHEFIKRTHYDPLVTKTLIEAELDVNKRSRALQDVVWSTSVQHGGGSSIVRNALATIDPDQSRDDFDESLIRAIYAERGRRRADGKLAWFAKSSTGVQAGVAKRFLNELSDALKMLADES
jgi:LysM repeat protein